MRRLLWAEVGWLSVRGGFPVPAGLLVGQNFVLHSSTVLETAIMFGNVIFV